MISIEQIKAARGLLDWTQDDLANACGISLPALNNIERRISAPRAETLRAIAAAFENAGVELIADRGVQLKNDRMEVVVWEGKESLLRLWNDILETLHEGEERLIGGVDEARFKAYEGKRFESMMQNYQRKGIKGRILSREGNHNFADPTSQYRWVPSAWFTQVPSYIYADKYAILLWEPVQRVVLMQNKSISDTYRAEFERMWEAAQIPT